MRILLVAGVPPGDGEAGGGGGLPPRPGCRGHQPRQEEAPAQHRGHGAGTGGHRSAVIGQWGHYTRLIGQWGHNTLL